jgi:hypothetical protein
MITQFGYFLYFIGKNHLLWNSVETHETLWFLYYLLLGNVLLDVPDRSFYEFLIDYE